MLKPNQVVIQDYGSSILLFLKGANETETRDLWVDLLNFGAIGSTAKGSDTHNVTEDDEPNFVSDNIVACWSTADKLVRYLYNRYLLRFSNDPAYKGRKGGADTDAYKQAEADYDAIVTESFRSVNATPVEYEMGTITAEREDLDFEGECWKAAFATK